MNEQSTDELRLRATEAQMRRALGLGNPSPGKAQTVHPVAPGNAHTHRRHFVRDGEVPVTVVHHEDAGGRNKFDEARLALRDQIAAREHAERQLQDALAAIETLRTQLAHERMAKEEALGQAKDQRSQIERQLDEERAARQQALQERDAAIAGRKEAEERLRQIMNAQVVPAPAKAPQRGRKPAASNPSDRGADRGSAISDPMPVAGAATVRKRRGRPPSVKEPETGFIEWWKPGWRERLR